MHKVIDVGDKEIRVLEHPEEENIEDYPAGEQAFPYSCPRCTAVPQNASRNSIVDPYGNEQVREIMQASPDEEKQGYGNEQIPGEQAVAPWFEQEISCNRKGQQKKDI
jgi:hypothetical protein